MSVKNKAMYILRDGKAHHKYEIRDEVRSWGRWYDEQTIDRALQLLVQDNTLRSKKIEGKMYYKLNV